MIADPSPITFAIHLVLGYGLTFLLCSDESPKRKSLAWGEPHSWDLVLSKHKLHQQTVSTSHLKSKFSWSPQILFKVDFPFYFSPVSVPLIRITLLSNIKSDKTYQINPKQIVVCTEIEFKLLKHILIHASGSLES